MRKKSAGFGHAFVTLFFAENKRQLWVSAGFAHGFCVTTENAELVYEYTDYYIPQFEQSLLWNDSNLKIGWSLVNDKAPLLSEKGVNGLLYKNAVTPKQN